MTSGNQTVTLVTNTLGAAGRFERVLTPTRTDIEDCRFRPLGTSEIVTETDLATEVWKLTKTGPLIPAALSAATAASQLEYNGKTYRVTGVKPFTDLAGVPFKVTVISERYIG